MFTTPVLDSWWQKQTHLYDVWVRTTAAAATIIQNFNFQGHTRINWTHTLHLFQYLYGAVKGCEGKGYIYGYSFDNIQLKSEKLNLNFFHSFN